MMFNRLFLSSCLLACAIASPIIDEKARIQLLKRQYSGANTANQLIDGTPCRDVTVIFARGTFEGGNIGAVVGPAFLQAVADKFGSDRVAGQGVEYPANVAGYLTGGDLGGSMNMSQLATRAYTQCPNTKLVLSGYSQGGQLVHNAAQFSSAAVQSFVNSVVIFGDPDQNSSVGSIPDSKVLKVCHTGDDICHGIPYITNDHLDYSDDAGTAAQFVADHAGLGKRDEDCG